MKRNPEKNRMRCRRRIPLLWFFGKLPLASQISYFDGQEAFFV